MRLELSIALVCIDILLKSFMAILNCQRYILSLIIYQTFNCSYYNWHLEAKEALVFVICT